MDLGKGLFHKLSHRLSICTNTPDTDQPAALQEDGSSRPNPDTPTDLHLYYNYDELVSKPKIAPNYTLPEDGSPVLRLTTGFGYDSYRRSNMHVLDANTLLFVMGSYIWVHRLDSPKGDTLIRCTGSGSVSCLALAPKSKVFACAESGNKPDINIFGYPSCKLHKVLRNGTQKYYSSVMFEPISEDLLVSQGAEPDYNITIWHWIREVPLVRRKSSSQDVYRVAFNDSLFGHLCASGEGYIRFWTMAMTFTGLKLQGQPGRFGVHDLSNIEAFVQLPDGKVMSGSEEGTILLWEETLLKAEFTRMKEPNCHLGKITQMSLHDYEVLTLGEDGYIRTWNLDEISFVEPDFHGQQFRLKVLLEVKIAENSSLVHMAHADPENEDCFDWYVQDREGKIWSVDLVNRMTPPPPRVLLDCHGGPVVGCAASHVAHLVATAGHDGTVRIFDCFQETELLSMAFAEPASCLVWVPLSVDLAGASVIVGFDDGIVRKLAFCGKENPGPTEKKNTLEGKLSQTFRAHKTRVTSLAFSNTGDIFVTGGEDKIIFLFKMKGTRFEPLGWVSVHTGVKQLVWTPSQFWRQGFLAVCEEGIVIQIKINNIMFHAEITDNYQFCNPKLQLFKFQSIKSEVQHAEKLARLKEELLKRKEEMVKQNDEESMEEEEEEADKVSIDLQCQILHEKYNWQPYYPESPSPILQALYSQNEGYFWLTLGGYDAGYVFLCCFPEIFGKEDDTSRFLTKPVKAVTVPDCSDTPITVMKIRETPWQTLALMGFENGHVRLVQLQQTMELDDLSVYWDLNVHDYKVGTLTGMEFAFNHCYLVTTAMDGNILMFSYTGLLEMTTRTASTIPFTTKHHDISEEDISSQDLWFPEEIERRKQQDVLREAEASKKQKRQALKELHDEFQSLLIQNKQLPLHCRLARQELLVNINIEKEHRERQQEKNAEIHRKWAWQQEKTRLLLEKAKHRFLQHEDLPNQFTVKAFNKSFQVKSYRVRFFCPRFEEFLTASTEQRRPSKTKGSEDSVEASERMSMDSTKIRDTWLKTYALSQRRSLEVTGTAGRSLQMQLKKAAKAHKKRYIRAQEWEKLYMEKEILGKANPEDLQAIEDAKNTIGDIKLKADPLNATDIARISSKTSVCQTLARLDKDCCDRIHAFNERLLKLREHKISVVHIFDVLNKQLHQMSRGVKSLPCPPDLCEEEIPEAKVTFDEQTLYMFKKDTQAVSTADTESELRLFKSHGKQTVTPPFDPNIPLGRHTYYKAERSDVPDIVEFALKRKMKRDDEISAATIPFEEINEGDSISAPEEEVDVFFQLHTDFEESLLKNFIGKLMEDFDENLRKVCKEQHELDVILKQADLMYICKLEEFLLNKQTFAEETMLAHESTKINQEIQQNQATSTHIKKQIAQKNEETESNSDKINDAWVDFECQYLDKVGHEWKRYFTNLYKRSISKKKPQSHELDQDETMSCSASYSLISDSGSESGLSLDLDFCPEGIEPEFYNEVQALQKQRQAIDDDQIAIKQVLVLLNKDLEQNAKESEILKRAEEKITQRLEAFCLEKSRMINEIITVVPLRLSQICTTVSSGLVLNRSELKRLRSRVGGLKEEIKAHKLVMQKHAWNDATERRGNHRLRKRINTWEKKCDEEILKKFGRPVKLEDLEMIMTDPKAETLKCNLITAKDNHIGELRNLDKEIQGMTRTVRGKVMKNTTLQQEKLSLLLEKNRLERCLDQRFGGRNTLNMEDPIRRDRARKREMASFNHLLHQQHSVIHECWEMVGLLQHGNSNGLNAHTLPPLSVHRASASRKVSVDGVSSTAGARHCSERLIPGSACGRPRLPKIAAKL